MMIKTIQLLLAALLLLPGMQHAFAEKFPYTPTEVEFTRLPNYCKIKLDPKMHRSDANRMWDDNFGHDTWIHVHHYCQGLNNINRYYSASNETQRKLFLSTAAGEFGYMVDHLPPDSSLLADVYQNRGRVLLMLGKSPDGVNDLQKALGLNPKNIQTYLLLAEQFEKWKNRENALQIISEGLRHAPSSKGLQQRYQELGGKLPYPEPLAAKAAETVTTQQTEPATAPPIQAASDTSPSTISEPPSEVPENNPPKGTPSNPYCRFCTE